MFNLLKRQEKGVDLINNLKEKNPEIYRYVYENYKNEIIKATLEDKQDELLFIANVEIVKNGFNDKRFNDYHVEEIKSLLKNDLEFKNLIKEYELYKRKDALIPDNKAMSYEELMSFDYDEDEELYKKDFNVMKKILESVKNLYIWGNAGNGKTSFAYKMADNLGLQLYNINSVKNEFSLKGFFDLNGDYHKSLYEKWYENGGVLLLDEVDSYSSNGMLYLNNGIEVNSKYLTLENGETIAKNEKCYVIACANTDGNGKTQDYIGRNSIDKAFMSRFTRKEYKEYAYIHKQILGKTNYKKFKKYFDTRNVDLTTRLCVKLNGLLESFAIDEVIGLIDNKEIEL